MSSPINLFERALLEFRRAQRNNKFPTLYINKEFPNNMLKPLQKMANNFDIPKQLQKITNNTDIAKQFKTMGDNVPKQVQKFTKNLNNTFGRLLNQTPAEDYNRIVKGFLPEHARLITPINPIQASAIRFADLDGDMQQEMVTSYVRGNETTTIVLKKLGGRWHKVGEIIEPSNNDIVYMGFANLTGEGKRQLLIGRKGENNTNILHSYNLTDGKFNKMFERNYNKLELIGMGGSKNIKAKKHVAIWNRSDENAYNIDVMHWNGRDLESVENIKPYYLKRVIPYYIQKIRQMPKNPDNWYRLADSLGNCGLYKDGLIAIKYGLRLRPESPVNNEFLALKARLEDKF